MDRVQALKLFLLFLKLLAICTIGMLGQSPSVVIVAAIILLKLYKRPSFISDIYDVLIIATTLLVTFLCPGLSSTFYVVPLSFYTLAILINSEKTSNLALGTTLVALVGFCLMSLRLIPSEVVSLHLFVWPLLLLAAIACLSEKSIMLLGVIAAIALSLDIENGLIAYTVLGVFAIELMSLQKQKALQTAVLLGLVISPFHTWVFVALALICLANQFKQNAETLRSFAAILSLFACLTNTNNLALITIILIGLLYVLTDNKRLEPLC